jgi:hypothetical protein
MPVIPWDWTRKRITPPDVLDAAKAMPPANDRSVMNLTTGWVDARRYFDWARAALHRGGEDGWDTASSLAKRAVCRQMDGILVHNHLRCFLGSNYGDKATYLKQLDVPGLSLLRDMVIDPRNEIEHAYELATPDQAQRAVDVAELFLRATDPEAATPAVVTLAWLVNYSEGISGVPGKECHVVDIDMRKEDEPVLLIDALTTEPTVFILYPRDEELAFCPLKDFKSDEAIALNAMLRAPLKAGSFSLRTLSRPFLEVARQHLKLHA